MGDYDIFFKRVVVLPRQDCAEIDEWPPGHGLEAVRAAIGEPALGQSFPCGTCAIGYAFEHSEGEKIMFQKEDGSPGGACAYLLKRLRSALPGETLWEFASMFRAVSVPSPSLAHMGQRVIGRAFPQGC